MEFMTNTVALAIKNICGSGLQLVLGRRNLYRFARTLMRRARRDSTYAPAENGELLVQDSVLNHLRPRVIFDVGANVGDWSALLLRRCAQREMRVYAFEPCGATFSALQRSVQDQRLISVPYACSDSCGTAAINIVEDGCGRNSLVEGLSGQTSTEQVVLTTIDAYCQQQGIDSVALIKIDAEGHDVAVMTGAQAMLKSHAIAVVQFEYNHRWIFSRTYLKDAFELLSSFGYSLGKVTPAGIEFYSEWEVELETFCEGNYLACLPEVQHIFPIVRPDWLRRNVSIAPAASPPELGN